MDISQENKQKSHANLIRFLKALHDAYIQITKVVC